MPSLQKGFIALFALSLSCDSPQATPRTQTSHTISTPTLAPKSLPKAPPKPKLLSPMARPKGWYRGVSLGLFASTTDRKEQERIYAMMLDEIVAVGATDISLVVRWAQQNIEATTIKPRAGLTPKDALLIWVVRQAHQRGLRVFVMPILYLDERGRKKWRGTLVPKNENRWWKNYTKFILHYASLLAPEKIRLFSVGSELLNMEPEKKRWLALIAKVRKAMPNTNLTYSGNWDHFEVPQFWDKLDVVGMTAYQELSGKKDPTVQELVAGWSIFEQRLSIWAREMDKRYIFTEVGYPSHTLGAKYPWNYVAKRPPAPKLQAKCYEALMTKWHQDSRLEGVFIWNWFGPKSIKDRGYTPRGKPAQKILEHWFSQSLPTQEH